MEGGGWQDRAMTGLLMKKKHQNGLQNVIFHIMSEVQKDFNNVFAGIGNFFYIRYTV
jgi:hypothetical protein